MRRSTRDPSARPLLVLVIGGLDPSGLAGIAADLSTLTALGAQSQVLLSTATAQSSEQWQKAWPVAPEQLHEQLACLALDTPPAAIKIGALGGLEQAQVIAAHLDQLASRTGCPPLVLDPVLQSSSGGELGQPAWLQPLLRHRPLLCPNRREQQALRDLPGLEACPLLVTDAAPGAVLQRPGEEPINYGYTRRAGEWRGTGCTLASLLAFGLATGLPLDQAVGRALCQLQLWLEGSCAPYITRQAVG